MDGAFSILNYFIEIKLLSIHYYYLWPKLFFIETRMIAVCACDTGFAWAPNGQIAQSIFLNVSVCRGGITGTGSG